MELQECKQYLKDNAGKDDVKAYLAELSKISPEKEIEIVNAYKKSDEFRSEIDRAVTKGLTTYKEKTVPGIVEDAVKVKEQELEAKYNPAKNPKEEAMEKKLKELDEKVKESENKIIRESIKSMKQHLLSEAGISVDIADWLSVNMKDLTVKDVEDKEKLKALIEPAIEPLAKLIEDAKIAKATEMQAGTATQFQQSSDSTNGQLTREQYNALDSDERVKAVDEGKCANILGQQQ